MGCWSQIKAHTSTAYCIEFDPSGRFAGSRASCCSSVSSHLVVGRKFVTGGADGLVCVFDAQELACIQSFDRLE